MHTSENPEDRRFDAELKFRLPAEDKAALSALAKVEARVSGRKCDVSDMGRKAVKEFNQRHSKTPPMEPSTASGGHQTIDHDKLFFPAEIAHFIGMSGPEIDASKDHGCPFFGRKTTIRWVRHWLDKKAGVSIS